MKIKEILFPVVCLLSGNAFAAPASVCDRLASPGETIPLLIPIEGAGATIELPFAAHTVIRPKKFDVTALDEGAANGPRRFLITAKKLGLTEQFTAFLGSPDDDKGYLSFALTSAKQARQVTKYCFQKKASGTGYEIGSIMEMMKAMIRDEPTYGRQTISSSVSLKGYERKVSLKATRVFRHENYTGYTFHAKNMSSKPLKLNLTSLAFGSPSQAVAIHTDHEILQPCSIFQSRNPKENGCVSQVRLIVTGGLKPSYITTQSTLPFIIEAEKVPQFGN